MEYSSLKAPLSKAIGCGTKAADLVEALRSTLDGEVGFRFSVPISGKSYSVRAMSAFPFADAQALPSVYSPEEMARQIELLTPEARYNPVVNPEYEKGWELYWTSIDGRVVAIARAMWIKNLRAVA